MTDPNLDTLARADAARLKAVAEALLPRLDGIEVLQNRTGLVMLPMRDTVEGTAFHLGEVLVSEAHIRMGDLQGYGMRKGYDLEAAMAMAVLDLALSSGDCAEAEAFCVRERATLAEADSEVLRRVEATRVNMETF
ncbi:MAG: phosphonate C-P lyase system protein PhnG [Pseudomonadota bacterium]